MPPAMLIDALQSVRRKVKWLSVAYGVGVAVACAVAFVLALISIDYLLNLPAAPRVALSLVMLAALGVLGTGSAWPDLAVAAVMAGLAITSGVAVLKHARADMQAARHVASVKPQ